MKHARPPDATNCTAPLIGANAMPSGSHWSRMLEADETISNSALKSLAAASMPALALCQNEFVPLVTNTNFGFFVSGAPVLFWLQPVCASSATYTNPSAADWFGFMA